MSCVHKYEGVIDQNSPSLRDRHREHPEHVHVQVQEDPDNTVAEVKASGLGMMKAVKAAKVTARGRSPAWFIV